MGAGTVGGATVGGSTVGGATVGGATVGGATVGGSTVVGSGTVVGSETLVGGEGVVTVVTGRVTVTCGFTAGPEDVARLAAADHPAAPTSTNPTNDLTPIPTAGMPGSRRPQSSCGPGPIGAYGR